MTMERVKGRLILAKAAQRRHLAPLRSYPPLRLAIAERSAIGFD